LPISSTQSTRPSSTTTRKLSRASLSTCASAIAWPLWLRSRLRFVAPSLRPVTSFASWPCRNVAASGPLTRRAALPAKGAAKGGPPAPAARAAATGSAGASVSVRLTGRSSPSQVDERVAEGVHDAHAVLGDVLARARAPEAHVPVAAEQRPPAAADAGEARRAPAGPAGARGRPHW